MAQTFLPTNHKPVVVSGEHGTCWAHREKKKKKTLMPQTLNSTASLSLVRTLIEGTSTDQGPGSCNCVRFHGPGRFALCAGGKVIRIWNVETGLLVQSFPEHGYQVACVASRRRKDHFASCAGKSSFVWDIATARTLRKFSTHSQRVNSVCYAGHNDDVLVSGSYDTSVHLYDLRSSSRAQVQELSEAKDSITTVLSPPDSNEIWTASVDGYVRIYDVRNAQASVDNLGTPVSSICLSNDRECILSSTLNNSLYLLDKSTGELLSIYRGHLSSIYKLECCILYDDSTVISGSEDGNVCLWDLAGDGDESLAKAQSCNRSPVSTVAAHPSDSLIITGNHSGAVEVWRVSHARQ